jgi:hypothetical protein
MFGSNLASVSFDRFDDLIETVGFSALGTGHLVVRFGISDGFHRALAAAAKDGGFSRSH